METDAERAVWARATLDLMSEEEDGVVDGRKVWIVSPPPQRNEELSALCQVLQQRKDKRSAAPYLRVQRQTERRHATSSATGRERLVFSSVSSELNC